MITTNNFDINKLVRENIKKLKPYQSARDQINDTNAILLDANENPYPSGYNRYPDPFQRKLKAKIGEIKNIATDSIFLGNGSDEIIDLLIRAFCVPGEDSILINVPTYGMYEVCANINNVNTIKINLDNNFKLNVDKILEQKSQAKIMILCSPNNPTGNLLEKESIFTLLDQFDGLIVIDEAYIDFSNDPGFLSEIKNYPNLIVLQTFSKSLAMAGIRLGMAFMNKDIVQILNKIKYPYNISQLNQEAALNALTSIPFSSEIKNIQQQKIWLTNELEKLDIVKKIWSSDANFLLVQFTYYQEVFEYLKKEGIIIRNRSTEPNCNACLRISVGSQEENSMLIASLKQFEKLKI